MNGEERRAVVLDHQRDLALALRGALAFNAWRSRIQYEDGAYLIRGGLVSKARGLVYHSTLGWRVIKREEKTLCRCWQCLDHQRDLARALPPAVSYERGTAAKGYRNKGGSYLTRKGGLVFKAHRLVYHSFGLAVRAVLDHQRDLALAERGVACDEPTGRPPTPSTPHPQPYNLHPQTYTLNPTPSNLHPTPYTLHPTPCTLHPTPYTLHSTP